MIKVSIIIPYVRPKKAERAINHAIDNAGISTLDFEIIAQEDVCRIGVAKMVNQMTTRVKGEMVAFIGDDTVPRKDWLKNALEAMETFPDGWGLVGLNDLTGRDLPCHWLGHKNLLPHIGGVFFCEEYNHLYCDVELMDRCKDLGRYFYSKEAIVEHDHELLHGTNVYKLTDLFYKEVYSEKNCIKDGELYRKRKDNNWK